MRHVLRVLLAVVIIAVLAIIFGIFMPFTPAAPPSWHQVHVGMQRSNVMAVVGAAQSGMYPEKIVETWYLDGVLGLRKLEVWYQKAPEDDRATIVREYVYWRPQRRYIYTRKEP